MRVTVCELPHERGALSTAWAKLCEHTTRHASELVLLPEFALVDPVWEAESFDPVRWAFAESQTDILLGRLPMLGAAQVVGTRPVSIEGRPFHQGFLWSAPGEVLPLRRKYFLPAEPGGWEARWYDRGDPDFPAFRVGEMTFGLNICSELWALETYAAYATLGVQVVLAPRATAAATTERWVAAGVVSAVRTGAFSLSSNRVDPTGGYGGVGWIISPEGKVLARTSPEAPFATLDIDLGASTAARVGYPGYMFNYQGATGNHSG